MNHLADAFFVWLEVAHEIEKHAAIAVEQVRGSSHPPIGARGGSMHDHIEMVRIEVVAYVLLFEQIEFRRGGRRHVVARGKLLRQIFSDEARAAGDQDAHYEGVRNEKCLWPKKL